MKIKFLLSFTILWCLLIASAFAQLNKQTELQAINKDIWQPFIEGVTKGVDDLYINVHSANFYWVAPGSFGRIMDMAEYTDDSKQVMARRIEKKESSAIEVRFLERNVKNDFAAERCIMKFTLQKEGAEPQVGYGVVQFFHRKENGVWKMVLQNGINQTVTVADYEKASPLENTQNFVK